MSVLCDHDAATAALADVLALAERRRGPDEADDRRARLYALARWACLRRLAEVRRKRPAPHASARPPAHGDGTEKPRAAKTAAGFRRPPRGRGAAAQT